VTNLDDADGPLSSGIYTHPDVCGGEPRIGQTRIPVWVLEQSRRLGASEQALLASYPMLHDADLAIAWAYVDTHQAEIDAQIRDNAEA
jgi:uncharacterized protein (DUF433 family)